MTISLKFTCHDAQAEAYARVLNVTATHEVIGVNANPAPVWFEVTDITGAQATGPGSGTRDPQFHDIVYLWDFGDARNAAPRTALNMPEAWKDLNTGFGRQVCHVYTDPGTFTVTIYAFEPATRRFGSTTLTVEITDANARFGADKTIIYNPGGLADTSGFANATVITTTWAKVIAARSVKGLTPCRILIAPGVTLMDTVLYDNIKPRWSNVRIGGMDPGSRPVIQVDRLKTPLVRDFLSDSRELVLYDLDFQGPWDSATETGRIIRPVNTRRGEGYEGNFLTLYHRCRFSGFEAITGCYETGANQKTYNIWNDTEITNWQNYGIFGGSRGPKTAVIGCSLHQHENALSGGPKNGMYNNHGALRDTESLYLSVSASDLFSRCGWSVGGTYNGYGVTADQATLRINTSGTPGRASYIDRVASEGHIWIEEQNSSQIDVPGNHVLDKILQVLGSRSNLGYGILCRYGGTTIRNLLAVMLNVPAASSNFTRHLLFASNSDGSSENDEEVALHNVTFVDLRDDNNAQGKEIGLYRGPVEVFGSGQDFTTITVENNVFVQPNRTGVPRTDEPLDLATQVPGFAARHKGPRYNFQHYETTLSAPVAGAGGTLDVPYTVIRQTIANTAGLDDGPATDQAYWLAHAGTDKRHRIRIDGRRNFHADIGEFSVAFGVLGVTITNHSGTTWEAGQNLRLRLDRSSRLPPFDPQLSSQGRVVPLAKPLGDSDAIDTGDAGRQAYDDLNRAQRPNAGNERGAICKA